MDPWAIIHTPEWDSIFYTYATYPAYSKASIKKIIAVDSGDESKSWLGIFLTIDLKLLLLRGNKLKNMSKPVGASILASDLRVLVKEMSSEENARLFQQINNYVDEYK